MKIEHLEKGYKRNHRLISLQLWKCDTCGWLGSKTFFHTKSKCRYCENTDVQRESQIK